MISAEHALVATMPAITSSPPTSGRTTTTTTTSGRAGSSSPEPETISVEPQTLADKSKPTVGLSPVSPLLEWNTEALISSSSSIKITEENVLKPIVTISQSASKEMSILAPNITIEYRGPVPTFNTPLQPPVRQHFHLSVYTQYVAKVTQQTPQFSLRILPTHPSSQDFDWLEMTDTVSDTIRNTPLGELLKVRIRFSDVLYDPPDLLRTRTSSTTREATLQRPCMR